MASGDTAYIGAGVYRETVTCNLTSPVAETRIIGDITGAYTGDAGSVQITAYTTNDTTAPAAATTLTLNGRDYLTFVDIEIVGGNRSPSCIDATTATSQNVTLRRLLLIAYPANDSIAFTTTANVAFTLTLDSCLWAGEATNACQINAPTSGTADYDVGVSVQNCKWNGYFGSCMRVTPSGALAFKPGGAILYNCQMIGATTVVVASANHSTSLPMLVYNCIVIGSTGMNAAGAGMITEDYCDFHCVTPRTNVSAGAHSQTIYPALLEWGQSELRGGIVRPFGMPAASSPQLGFGAQAGGPSVDMLGYARPTAGQGANSVGALERETIGGGGLILATRRVYQISRPQVRRPVVLSGAGSVAIVSNRRRLIVSRGERPRRPPTILTMGGPVLTRPLRVY